METPIAVAEMRIPVTLGGRERVMRFNANTFIAYEQSTGRFFMDTVSNLYEIMFPKGHEDVKGKPVPVRISGRDVLRKVSMVDLRAMLWASMHEYDAQGEPLWPDTEAQVGRCLDFHNVVPIWGLQHRHELDELLDLDADPPELDDAIQQRISKDRKELAGDFCRACGYCLPCPAEIPIPMAARMPLLLRRMPYRQFMTDEWHDKMERIRTCRECGHCRKHCPYGLDTPALLRKALADYESFRAAGFAPPDASVMPQH